MWKISWVPFRILQSHKALLSNWSTEIPSQIRSQNSMTSLTFLWMLEQFVTIVFATPVIRLGKLWGLLNTWSSRTNVKMVKYLFTTFMAFVPMKHVFFILISFSPLHFPAPSLSNVSTSTNAFTAAFTTLIHSYSPLYLGQRAGNWYVAGTYSVFKSFKGSTWTLNLVFHNVELSNHPKLRFSYIRENINYIKEWLRGFETDLRSINQFLLIPSPQPLSHPLTISECTAGSQGHFGA